jgi:homoserine kinase
MNTSNLAYQVYLDCFKRNNQPLYPVRITFTQGLPFCGGVGSSANRCDCKPYRLSLFLWRNIHKNQLIKEATYYEHHPDNVAAAILGGLTSCGYDA